MKFQIQKIDDNNLEKDIKNIEIEESIDDNEPQIIENKNILEEEYTKEVSDEKDKDRKENDNLFDIKEKQRKKNKKIEFTDFYILNKDLYYKKVMKQKNKYSIFYLLFR